MNLSELQHKSILIIGFAREGMATFAFLKKYLPENAITITDTRSLEELPKDAQDMIRKHHPNLLLSTDYLAHLEEFDVIIKIPSLSYLDPAIKAVLRRGQCVTSSTNIFYANTSAEVIAVTGSKGKSTTSTLIYQILKHAGKNVELIGNIGEPAIAYLGKETPEQIYVFEMSSYQLEDFKYAPHIGVFVSFFPDHLDHHGSLEAYFEAKCGIARHMKSSDTLIYNAASETIRTFAHSLECHKVGFNNGTNSTIKEDGLYDRDEKIISLDQVQLIGKHNLENILGVIAAVKMYHISNQSIQEVITSFTGLEHRLENVGTYQDITFYNDAISTTPESSMAAINAMPQRVGTIILGGLDRGYDFHEIADLILDKAIPNIILFPDSGRKIWETIKEVAKDRPLPSHHHAASMKDCIDIAYRITPKDTICLLSCASPSYSIFKNFEDKGRQFKEYVQRI